MIPRQVFFEYAPGLARTHADWAFCPRCGSKLAASGDEPATHHACSNRACGFRHYRSASPAVSVLVPDNGRVLLCRRRHGQALGGGKWCLPCGYVDYPEDFLTAARREVREETGVEVVIDGLISVVSNFFNPEAHSIVAVLLGRMTGGVLAAGDDAIDAGWFDPRDETIAWAFESDAHIVARWFERPFDGAPVDPLYGR